MNHNEVIGWERPGPASAAAAAVFVSDGGEHPRVRRRIELTAEFLGRLGVAVVHAPVPAGSPLARWAVLALLGDYLSLHLAMLSGVDPTPIVSLDELKRRLCEGDPLRAEPGEPRTNPNP
jgi:glucose/mannose-6-phosphate isomerase